MKASETLLKLNNGLTKAACWNGHVAKRKLVNEYAGKFDELDDGVREMRKNLEEKINGLIIDLEYEAREAFEGAVEVGLLDDR